MIEIITTTIGKAALIEIKGRVDGINARELQSAIKKQTDYGNTRILLKLKEVNHLSAAGLRILTWLYGELGEVHLVAPSDRVREVLQITGLDNVYKTYVDEARAAHILNRVTNAHTHLELGWLADRCPGVGGMEFFSWMRSVVMQGWGTLGNKRQESARAATEESIKKLLNAGITTVGDISLTGESIGPLLESSLKGIVYVELNGIDEIEGRFERVKQLIETWRPKERPDFKIGLSIHAPYSVHPDLWKLGLEYARKERLPLCIHAAETAAEHTYLTKGGGPVREHYEALNLAPVPVPGKSPIAYLEDLGALDLRPLLVHCVHIDDEDIKRIKENHCIVVHCPRSNLRLRAGRMPLEKLLDEGVPVLLGTDSLASAPSLNIYDEVEMAAALHYERVRAGQIANLVSGTLPGID